MVVSTYQAPVYNLCYRMLGSPQDAEDAAQETFWRAYQGLAKYDPARPFVTWLLSIAAHYCIDQHRRKKLPNLEIDDVMEEVLPDYNPGPELTYSRNEEERRLHQVIETLQPHDRAAVVLHYWYDFSDQEVAAALSLSVSAVKSRLFRARQQLAKNWKAAQTEAPTPLEEP